MHGTEKMHTASPLASGATSATMGMRIRIGKTNTLTRPMQEKAWRNGNESRTMGVVLGIEAVRP